MVPIETSSKKTTIKLDFATWNLPLFFVQTLGSTGKKIAQSGF